MTEISLPDGKVCAKFRQALETAQTNLPSGVGKFLGAGSEGMVFQHDEGAIKITFLPHQGVIKHNVKNLIDWFKNREVNCVVQAYNFGNLPNGYWYTMERLYSLEEAEAIHLKKYFYEVTDHYLAGTNYPGDGRSKNGRRKRAFLRSLNDLARTHNIRHRDFAPFNVMKNSAGNWKLIDLEGFVLS